MKDNDPLLKLAKYNREVRETFEIVEDTSLDFAPQYFIMYMLSEWQGFDPTKIIGFRSATEMAQAIAHYRQTGILRWTLYPDHPMAPRHYEEVQPAGIYVLHTEAILYKKLKFEEVETPEFDDFPL